jgi:serine/threonine protein kinase
MQPGSTVNQRYEILSEIGRGGMGVVYRARNLALGKDVAIKIFNDSVDPDGISRAKREAQALANVQHENLVHVFALETNEKGQLMLIFDFIEGETLSALLARASAIGYADIENLFTQLCNGLQALHDNGFVHRDIKPANIMVQFGPTGLQAVIIDLGLAKSIQRSQKLTATGMVLGTPVYMSPEQFAGAQASAQSDLYSAACVLYEMLTGKPPFEDESPYVVATMHMAANVAPLPPEFPNADSLNAFFQKALGKAASERFSSASEMSQAYSIAQRGIGDQVAVRSPERKAARISKKKLLIAIGICVGIVVGTTGLATLYNSAANENDKKAQIEEFAGEAIQTIKTDYWEKKPHDYHGARAFSSAKIAELERLGEGRLKMAKLYALYGSLCVNSDDLNQPIDPQASRTALHKALDLTRKYEGPKLQIADIYYDLAGAYKSEDQFPKAYEYMQMAMKTAKQTPPAGLTKDHQQMLGLMLEKLHRHDEFLQIFERKILSNDELHGGTIDSLRRTLARVYLSRGRSNEALKVLAKNMYSPDMQDLGREHDLPLLAVAAAVEADSVRDSQGLAEAKRYAEMSQNYVEEAQALALREENKTHMRPWQRACLALSYAVDGRKARAAQFIDRQLAVDLDQKSSESNRDYRDRLFDAMDGDSLCEKASKRIGDEHRAAQCRDHAQQIKKKLIEQECLPSA